MEVIGWTILPVRVPQRDESTHCVGMSGRELGKRETKEGGESAESDICMQVGEKLRLNQGW